MNQYEVLYVITPELDDEANQSVQDKFAKIITDNGGEIEKTDVWGKRRLAYAIDYKTEGFYVLVNFNANPELPRELERNLRNDERIMRYMVTRKEA
ncbi:MAG: 30S ribosomal protein S6 [Clostridia bacterium]|jgi:small subunit ribosomal protein S6|nr:30S ribosomal protein S6 [Clostridia bacterium]MDO4852049.1 30S ribosomal protein S6 [Clostridia bacterium]